MPKLRVRDKRACSSRRQPIAGLFVSKRPISIVSAGGRQSVFISPAALRAWVMTARMSTAEDRGAPVDEDGRSGLSSVTMVEGGRGMFPTDLLSSAAALRGTCARPQNFAMR